ncbi:uncharacterized protein MYCGRDRAFT_105669 [Zymoseptoria tritici IPO323]|uniref:Uncharacterized protein n=1 Tax=Zymoseptoria tritici (strain CBS 115943 / IPO323) TaxID=336722 RepID=F9XJ66_ZYMTI|nr:uncharacterized protein MYCGRDRAFT_105669 [Zymoseptoria tritici IPO323]EGP84771.1 hypothetical protein MYCGRDRAFT_105669 [Zymoseptoria tritici IPO323]
MRRRYTMVSLLSSVFRQPHCSLIGKQAGTGLLLRCQVHDIARGKQKVPAHSQRALDKGTGFNKDAVVVVSLPSLHYHSPLLS